MGKDDLLALGLDEETVNKVIVMHGKATEKLKDKVATLEGTVNDTNEQLSSMTDKYTELKGKVEEVDTVKKTYEDKLSNYTKELETYKTKEVLNKHGVDDDFKDYVSFKVKDRVSDEKDFETALSEFIKENPQYTGQTKSVDTSPKLEGEAEVMNKKEKANNAFKALAKQ